MTIERSTPLWYYHSQRAVSSSKLSTFRQSPLLFRKQFLDGVITKEKTAALNEGAGFDSLLFDGDETFAANYVVTPETYPSDKGEMKPWHGGANFCKQWAKEQEDAGRTVLAKDAMVRFTAMREAIRNSELAQALMANGEAQVSIRLHSQKFGLDVQTRPDWLSLEPIDRPDLGLWSDGRPYIVDLKTTADFNDWHNPLDPEDPRAGSPVYRYGYALQGSLAQWIASQETEIGKTAHFLLVVEKQEPFRVGVVILSDDYLEMAWSEVCADLHRLAACMKVGVWPGSPPRPITLYPKQWQLEQSVRRAVHSGALAQEG